MSFQASKLDPRKRIDNLPQISHLPGVWLDWSEPSIFGRISCSITGVSLMPTAKKTSATKGGKSVDIHGVDDNANSVLLLLLTHLADWCGQRRLSGKANQRNVNLRALYNVSHAHIPSHWSTGLL